MKTPVCVGSNQSAPDRTDPKRAQCPHCHHIVAVTNGEMVTHWWSQRLGRIQKVHKQWT